jgi:hypothetical protein
MQEIYEQVRSTRRLEYGLYWHAERRQLQDGLSPRYYATATKWNMTFGIYNGSYGKDGRVYETLAGRE